jgi:ribosome-associated protein
MISVNGHIFIDEREIEFDFIKASGPGGQNVNKVSSAVQLRFNVKESPNLPDEVRSRLMRQAGNKISGEGVLVVEAARHRKQALNRKEAIDRLVALIRQASHQPKKRIRTKPSKASKERRREAKRRRSRIKKMRRPVHSEEV